MMTGKPNAIMSHITMTSQTIVPDVYSVVNGSLDAAALFLFPDATRPMSHDEMLTMRLLLVGYEAVYWNMVILNPQMELWRRSWYFAFKCLEIQNDGSWVSRLKLQVHWMPKRSQPSEPLPWSTEEFSRVFQDYYREGIGYNCDDSGGRDDSNSSLVAARRANRHPIESGDIFYICR
jgi:hypothetical protein